MRKKNAMESKAYRLTPVSISLRMIPSFASDAQPGNLATIGAYSPAMNVNEIESGAKETESLLKKYKELYRKGNRRAVLDLIDINPAFALDAWVAEKVYAIRKTGFPSRRRGRPYGTSSFHPLIILGLVDWMISTGKAKNKERTFWEIKDWWDCSYDTIKKKYYDAKGNKYIQQLLVLKKGEDREISSTEFKNLIVSVVS